MIDRIEDAEQMESYPKGSCRLGSHCRCVSEPTLCPNWDDNSSAPAMNEEIARIIRKHNTPIGHWCYNATPDQLAHEIAALLPSRDDVLGEVACWHEHEAELVMGSLHCGDNTSTIAAARRCAEFHKSCAVAIRALKSAPARPAVLAPMSKDAAEFIARLRRTAEYETAEWMSDPNNAHAPDRKPTDHIAWEAAAWLQAIFDPENQPSQFGTMLVAAPQTLLLSVENTK